MMLTSEDTSGVLILRMQQQQLLLQLSHLLNDVVAFRAGAADEEAALRQPAEVRRIRISSKCS
jgi:hypothetical protein